MIKVSRFWIYTDKLLSQIKLTSLQKVLIVSISVTGLLLGVRHLGLLQNLELAAFDNLLQMRPNEGLDPRLLLVTADEEDINKYGYPLPDETLAQLIKRLEEYHPQVIGLAIFRDRPVGKRSGENNLAAHLKQNKHLIGICKVIDPKVAEPGIPPPSELPKDRTGFSDVVTDANNILRRHLLALTPDPKSPCTVPFAFSTRLALDYLATKGISSKFISQGDLQLGTVIFKRLKPHTGGYQGIDAGGYQVLLNYRSSQQIAPEVTLADALNNRISPDLIKGRIVLIGVSASSVKDDFLTPYSHTQPTRGLRVHAQMVSQILGAVLDRRPLLWTWSQWGEYFWIWSWSLVGGIVTWRLRSLLKLGLVGGATLSALYGICFLLLVEEGVWVPLTPSVLALIVTGVGIFIGIFTRRIFIRLLSRRIIGAYYEEPKSALQTITYLITSASMQEIGVQAMTNIVANALRSCQTLTDIVVIADQLAWIPLPPPKSLNPVITKFLEVSQGVRAALGATSLYRQYELLGPPIGMLCHLRDSLVFIADVTLATTFGSIIRHWLTVLETAQHNLEAQTSLSLEIPQVYVAGPALDPESASTRFKGRIDLFREIENLVLSKQPPILLLHGGRRTGKTSTLKYLPQRLGPELVPLLVDVQGAAIATTLRGLAEYLAEQIINAARRSRNLYLPFPDADGLARDPFPTLQKWLEQVEQIAEGKRFLLCLDEFERLSEVVEETGSRVPLNFLRHVLQHCRQWTLLFSGSCTLEELPHYWSDYLIDTHALQVSYLSEAEARELITQPVEEFLDIYEAEAVDSIIQLTHCHPYLVQLICYTLIERLNQAKRQRATSDDINSVIPRALETGKMYFRELWDQRLGDSERFLLLRLVNGEIPGKADKVLLQKLTHKEVLEKTGDGYRFQVPLVRKFVEQVIMEEV